MKKINTVLEIALVGMSHKTAPVEMRECFSLHDDDVPGFLERSHARGVDEVVYVSTCNRVEIYFASADIQKSMQVILDELEKLSSLRHHEFDAVMYRKYSRDAVLHMLTVASSLDSMVVGENEIIGQMKKAYGRSVQKKKTGVVLNRLFHQAFKTAKRIRTETGISKNPLSIAYIATELAKKIFENLGERKALLIGAGEMGELILKYLTKYNIGDITIANRSLHNAERIAGDINRSAHIIPLDDVAKAARDVDIIISSVSSPSYVITDVMTKELQKHREHQPLFLIDIAVPRNIDPRIADFHDIFLYNIDDLKMIADENLRSRLNEVEIAEKMIESDADEFYQWYEGLEVVPAIQRIKTTFDEIRKKELKKYRQRKLKHLSDEDFKYIEDLTAQIMTKTLHNPIMHLKQYQSETSGHPERDSIREKTKLIVELFEK
ncbi:MAG TPA: glutamyl-tRNA reductase [Spirochaetota bacterium]|nr:glutamyl-tRNA reductase [Spirochaetota bacterium]